MNRLYYVVIIIFIIFWASLMSGEIKQNDIDCYLGITERNNKNVICDK